MSYQLHLCCRAARVVAFEVAASVGAIGVAIDVGEAADEAVAIEADVAIIVVSIVVVSMVVADVADEAIGMADEDEAVAEATEVGIIVVVVVGSEVGVEAGSSDVIREYNSVSERMRMTEQQKWQ